MADTIELTDLEVISRYSLAVRAASADRTDLIAALRADLAWLEGGRRAAAPAAAKPAAKAPVAKTPAKKAPAKKAPAKKAAAKKTTRSR